MPISDNLYGEASERRVYSDLLTPMMESYIASKAVCHYDVSLPKAGVNADFSGTAISKVYDLTLTQDHAVQATELNKPQLSNTSLQNLRQYIQFTGTDPDQLVSDVNMNSTNISVFVLYKLGSAPSGSGITNGIFGADAGTWGKGVVFENGVLAIGDSQATSWQFVTAQTNASPQTPSVWNLLSVHWNGTTSDASRLWCNGKQLASFTNKNSAANANMYIGRDSYVGYHPFTGDVAEFLVFKEEVSNLNTRRLHEHLRRKWGVAFWDSIVIT